MIKWKWWKKHTGEAPKEYEVANGDVEPVQETPVPEKDISEPVTSFIKCFEANPRRFKVEQPVIKELDCPVLSTYASRSKYKLIDKKTGESWKVFLVSYYQYNNKVVDNEWLTQDEVDLLTLTIVGYYASRSEKLRAIKIQKHNAKMMKERDRLTKIYKENKE